MDINAILYPVLTLGGMGALFGAGLGFAAIKFRVEVDPNLPLVREALPGANCGACGYTGCDGYAAAVVAGEAPANNCPVGGASCAAAIGEILGIKVEIKEREAAYVMCRGSFSNAVFRYDYFGLEDCAAVMQLAGGGSKSCAYGCLGVGSCVHACEYDAVSIVDGIAVIDPEKCTACKKCVGACPRSLIELVPVASQTRVACHTRDVGKAVRANCTVGCIGCKMCEKACPHDAIKVENLLAHIDYEKCTQCGDCVAKCPMKCIVQL